MAEHAKVTLTWESKQLVTLSQKAMTAGLREAGKYARKGLKAELRGAKAQNAPAGPGKVSGELAKTVSYRVKQRAGKFSAMDVGVIRPNPHDKKYPGESYAKALRLARGFVGRDRLGRVYSQRGRPFVDRFLSRERSKLVEIVNDTANTWMPKAKKGS